MIERQSQDGLDAAILSTYRSLWPRQQRAFRDALLRSIDGEPLEDSFLEMFIELGDSPALARQKVAEAFQATSDWRTDLN